MRRALKIAGLAAIAAGRLALLMGEFVAFFVVATSLYAWNGWPYALILFGVAFGMGVWVG